MKFFYIFKIDQQITELWHFEILQRGVRRTGFPTHFRWKLKI